MARSVRKKSKTGIYHIMLRGIDRRDIFLEDEDSEKFLYYLFRAKEVGGFELYVINVFLNGTSYYDMTRQA